MRKRNPLRAGLAGRAEEWPWQSLHAATSGPAAAIRLDPGPAPRGEGWVEAVNLPMFETDVARVRESVRRDRPLGDPIWTVATVEALRQFRRRYNEQWLIERHGYRPPARVRRELLGGVPAVA